MTSGLLEDNEKVVSKFQAQRFSSLKEFPDFYTFNKGLFYSHRDFDKFFERLKKGEKSAIVSGLNPSSTLQLGHKTVFDTNLFFQKKYGIPVFIPLSDDESYVAKKVKNREEAVEHGVDLIIDLLAYGFDPGLTKVVFDFYYTDIFSIAMNLSRHVTLSEIKAVYGYKNDDNIGLHFYPNIQSAHVLLPQIAYATKNVLVPIGPDEDSHLRLCRDIASRVGYEKPAILHARFMPGVDGLKMSKSRPDYAIFLHDNPETIAKKISKAFSGGRDTIEEHRKLGGNPDIDISFLYLSTYFLGIQEVKKLREDYLHGVVLSGQLKNMLIEKINDFIAEFKIRREHVTFDQIEKILLRGNDGARLEQIKDIFEKIR
jgi:tryptophanyl-tRNA synthetase